jgi:DNA-binding LytR/AlgR family response regulator
VGIIMIQIAVCDGCRKDADLLIEHINSYTSDIGQLVRPQYFKSGIGLVDSIVRDSTMYNIIFLETILEGMNGIDSARRIRHIDREVPIIYLTTSRDYAVESYEVHAADYILKPFNVGRINACLDKYINMGGVSG